MFDLNKNTEVYKQADYDNIVYRFISYFHQIKLVEKVQPEKILEVGIGNKTVSSYLKQAGMSLVACDYNQYLYPDVVADVGALPYDNNSFDLILCCEVLEHIPFIRLIDALEEIYRVSNDVVIISLPDSGYSLEVLVKFSIPIINKWASEFLITIKNPIPITKHKFDGFHYWEIGKIGYSRKSIRELLGKYFLILSEEFPPLHSYHRFYVMKKRYSGE